MRHGGLILARFGVRAGFDASAKPLGGAKNSKRALNRCCSSNGRTTESLLTRPQQPRAPLVSRKASKAVSWTHTSRATEAAAQHYNAR